MNNITPAYIKEHINSQISICGCVYKIRKSSGLSFVLLRNGKYTYQTVYIPDLCKTPLSLICEGAYVCICGDVTEEKRAEYGFEITIKSFDVLSFPKEDIPFSSAQTTLGANINDAISNPQAAIKHARTRAILQIRGAVSYAYAQFMQKNNYIAINTPKTTSIHTGANYISVRYFDKDLSLTSSPSLYKIMAVGGLDNVYEIGAGYFGRHGNSLRHLNEYTRLDFENSYSSDKDTIKTLTDCINYICTYVSGNCKNELEYLDILISIPDTIPTIEYNEAILILQKQSSQTELDPTDEQKLCKYSQERYNYNYIFVTNIPSDKRPFYEKDEKGFVLLSNGIEIASGGEHISDYDEQLNKIICRGMNITDYSEFLATHKYALPQISGGAIGLERFIMALLNLSNIREASFIARDFNHTI